MTSKNTGQDRTEPGARSLSVSAGFSDTLVAVKHLDAATMGSRGTFHVGTNGAADVACGESPSPVFALIRPRNGRFVLRFERHWDGWVSAARQLWSLSELVESGRATPSSDGRVMEYPIPADCTIQLHLGRIEFWIRPSLVPGKLPRPASAQRGPGLYRYVLASAAFFLAAVLVLPKITNAEDRVLDEEAIILVTRQAETRSKKLEEEQRRNAPEQRIAQRVHRPTAIPRERKLLKSSTPSVIEQITPATAIEQTKARTRAKQAGILGALAQRKGLGSPAFDAYVAGLNFDASPESLEEALKQYGDFDPADIDLKSGGWGHKVHQMGKGKTYESVKAGSYELANASERGDNYAAKALPPRKSAPPQTSEAADALSNSGLHYDVIRGQLGMRKRKLRQCFELDEGIDFPPNRLLMAFRISSTGKVADAQAEDVEHPGVRSCVEKTLLSIRFPEPSDGNAVQIRGFSLQI